MTPKQLETKWQQKWQDTKLYTFDKTKLDKKFYMLEMFSYPSSSTLHFGHWFNYALSDSYARFKSMQGFNLFHPMGFDSFGLPAENYALKTGIHPKVSTYKNIEKMKTQFASMGGTFDWDYYLATSDPSYYKWTQWIFTKLFEKGLAYQKHALVNWCTSCQTVLANEQVIDAKCERCGNDVIRKKMTQWFYKITDYAERLLNDLDKLDWPEKTKIAQKNWIGKSQGADVCFKLENNEKITVFTSRPDTLFGVTFLAIAPEHPLVESLTKPEQQENVKKYLQTAFKKDDITRQSLAEEKTGVFTGSYAVSPVTGKKVPVFVADYVLGSYATGAVMGVAAHDERDFDFAKKYNLEIIQVIKANEGETVLPFTQDGILINSENFSNQTSEQARQSITAHLEDLKMGNKKINYRLRDWSVSRQRYWGAPIPIIYDKDGKAHAVPESQLPVTLPEISDYRPQGTSPLGQNKEYMSATVPGTNQPGTRDADTLDTFNCSAWYFLRHPSANLDTAPFDKELTNKVLPVDKYVGGMEHATGHLLYARFITKFLFDCGYIDFDEPFKSLIHQGMILGSDGQKMSKSKANTINLDDDIEIYGADAIRLYLAFGFNYTEGGPWNDNGIKNMSKFLERVERIVKKYSPSNRNELDAHTLFEMKNNQITNNNLKEKQEYLLQQISQLEYVLNNTIKEVGENYEDFGFNSAVARIMELVNAIYKYDGEEYLHLQTMIDSIEKLVLLIAPLAPHHAEEFWQSLGNPYSVHKQSFPKFDESKLQKQTTEIAVQINSKIVARIDVKTNMPENEVVEKVKQNERASSHLQNKTIIKQIYIPNKLINLIVK
jgi:leucyl-tRNA synthetase